MAKLLDAGMRVFGERGFHAARVDDIVRAARASHGTFYLYFSSKEDLLLTLAVQCSEQIEGLATTLGDIGPDEAGWQELRRFLDEFFTTYSAYGPVIRAWMEDHVDDRQVNRLGVGAFTAIATALGQRMHAAGAPGGEAPVASLMALLERFAYFRACRAGSSSTTTSRSTPSPTCCTEDSSARPRSRTSCTRPRRMDAIEGQLLASELQHNPYPFFARLRRDAPVWRLPGENAYLVSTWNLVAEATSRVQDFSNHFRYTLFSHDDGTLGALETGALGPDVFAGADPPAHTAQRKIFFPELVQKKIDTLEPYVAALANELLDALLSGDGGDAALGLAHPLPIRVVAERVIGFREPDVDQIRQWVFDGSRLVGGLLTLDRMAALSGAVSRMPSWTMAQLDDALASSASRAGERSALHAPGAPWRAERAGDHASEGDVLGAAAAGVRSGGLTRDEAAFTLMVLVGAGAETTTSLIGNAIGLLAERPLLQDELRADPNRLGAFIEEVLRFESPFRYHPRTAAHAVELGGVEIPEGALVMLLWSAANRDEAVFEHPDEIVLDRHNTHLHFGFGRGIHHCVGAPLARLEARVVLAALLERTKWFALDADRPQKWADSVWIRRHEHLPLVLETS